MNILPDRGSIRSQFTFGLVTVVTVIIILFSCGLTLYNIQAIEKKLYAQLNKIASRAEKSLVIALWQYNHEYVNDYVDSLFFYEDIVYVNVRDDHQNIKTRAIPRYRGENTEFFKTDHRFIHKTVSILNDATPIGEIFIAMTLDRVKKQILFTSFMTVFLLITLVTSIVFTVFWLSRKYFFTPLSSLERSARKISMGNFNATIDVTATNEIGNLARTFRQMIQNIKAVTASRDELDHEITQRIKAEKALQAHRNHLEEIVKKRTRELNLAQESLLRKEKLATIGELSGNISHELKNSLGVIDSSAYFLSMVLVDADEKVKTHLDRIKSAVGAGDSVIRSLANLTQVTTLEFKLLNVVSLIGNAIETSDLLDVAVTINFPDDDITVDGDKEALLLAFKNIIKNAVLSMEGHGTLDIRGKYKDTDYLYIYFSDTGPGIDKAILHRVFEPLFTTRAKGMGFGLSITHNVIEKHHGDITVTSEKDNGATFLITLPIVGRAEDA
ncbi:Signal transduction histidine kinase [Desulfocicer vacuolatum DSM 3385]|uniref:histidine kinase n=1 Tax=Desulfocicer vacuolatum DSM 3385 TaxID=1121400 RepID=A0A1W2B8F8_9BACT|nr:HAMP domain-containing sensor histidine kinase [Desulfocicer vacuolatum]SMC69134.1 Signal transduction histidine kinase [Desulfocicer vacuolatum DSM 3385]